MVPMNKLSYCGGQDPWILNDTLQNNILFQNKQFFDEEKYNKILDSVGLVQDLQSFTHYD